MQGTRKLGLCSDALSNPSSKSGMHSMNLKQPLLVALLMACSVAPSQAAMAPPSGITQTTSVEGITEYRLDNGLKVLLFPDASKQTITVNITYLVGSRHENYGETGMAHLLEHMLFKGTPQHPNIPAELSCTWRAAQWHHLV